MTARQAQEWVTVSTVFMSEALRAVVPELPRSRSDRSNSIEHFEFSKRLLRALALELESQEPSCDHSVGICACGEQAILSELKLLLAGRTTCPSCSGDGYTDEFESCTECGGSGSVPAPDGHVER